MRKACVEQRADDVAHAARGVEMVHIARTVGIDPRDQRDACDSSARSFQSKAIPAARAIAGMWIAWLVDPPVASRPIAAFTIAFSSTHAAQRTIIVAVRPHRGEAMHRGAGQRLPQLRARLDEGGARHVQAHHLHHHLVGIGGAVESAGARGMIAGDLALEQIARGLPCPRHRAGGRPAFPCWGCRSASGRPARRSRAGGRSAARRSPGRARSCRRCRAAPCRRTSAWLSATAVDSAIASRLNSDSSMPSCPCVTPSHIAGVPPATCAVAPTSRA